MDPSQPHGSSYDACIDVSHLPAELSQSVANYQNKIARYLFEISCLDGLEDFSRKRFLPPRFMKYLQKVFDLYDESIQFLIGHLRHKGFKIQCRPGCSHCCFHMPTGLSTTELIYLYHGMHQGGLFSRFFRHCLESEELLVEVLHRCTNPLSSSSDGRNLQEILLHSYHHLQQPCPFLNHDMCQLYAFRPFACRMHFSLSPPAWCHPSHFQHSYAVRFNLEPGDCVIDALQRLDKRFSFDLSDVMVCGLLELTVNVMQFEKIRLDH